MKRLLTVLIALALLLPAAGLAQTVIDPTADRNIDPRRGLGNNPVIPGESMTTGLPSDGTYIPMLINIDNVIGAFPQWGIAKADIIYEMPIHGYGLTRLMALITNDHPASVGPVRSGRVMHAELREEWDAAWVYYGVQTAAGSSVDSYLQQLNVKDRPFDLFINGLDKGNKWDAYFRNVSEYKNPHNHAVRTEKLADHLKDHPFPQRPFLFTDELPAIGEAAESISLAYGEEGTSYLSSSYEYDQATNEYARFRNSYRYRDLDEPRVQLTFSNVIVQWTELAFNNGRFNAPLLTLVGEGNADIFTGGRHIAGYWVRESVQARTVFYDQDGQEIRLQRGKTFINITSDKSTKVSYK